MRHIAQCCYNKLHMQINCNNTKRRVKQANFDIVNDIFLTYLYKYFHVMNANKALYMFQVAFDGIKNFPRRKDIATKQACYLKNLKEQNKRKELQRLAFAEREHMVS